jgi:hypothetical protein
MVAIKELRAILAEERLHTLFQEPLNCCRKQFILRNAGQIMLLFYGRCYNEEFSDTTVKHNKTHDNSQPFWLLIIKI